MSEMRLQEVTLFGRMVGDPIFREEGTYFLFEADSRQKPFPCFCEGQTAKNMKEYLRDGDEFTIEGKLVWKNFSDTGLKLLVYARFISYGRKNRTLREVPALE